MGWAVDQQHFFQIEMFQYRVPVARPRRAGWKASDLEYSLFGVHVPDFDATLERLAALGSATLSAPIGAAGERRVCVVDPDGALVELMEDDPRTPTPLEREHPDIPAITRFARASVPI